MTGQKRIDAADKPLRRVIRHQFAISGALPDLTDFCYVIHDTQSICISRTRKCSLAPKPWPVSAKEPLAWPFDNGFIVMENDIKTVLHRLDRAVALKAAQFELDNAQLARVYTITDRKEAGC